MQRTFFDKVWDDHVIRDLGNGWALLHIDRHLLHGLSGPRALVEVAKRGLEIPWFELVCANPDRAVSGERSRTGQTFGPAAKALQRLARRCTLVPRNRAVGATP